MAGPAAGSWFAEDALTDGLQIVADAEQALGMPDHQVTAGGQLPREFLHQGRARRGIEIDHHIPAEDHVLIARQRVIGLEQVDALKPNALPELGLHPAAAILVAHASLKITPQ